LTEPRKHITAKLRARVFNANGGICHICGGKIGAIRPERWEVEHIIPLALGGEDEPENMAPAHYQCHKEKTKEDVKQIAKSKRIINRHKGFRTESRSAMPCGRRSIWKKKMDGTVVRRDLR